jgi:UDP-glucuronate 4-epimerase
LAEGHEVLGIDAMTDYYDPQLKRDRLAQFDGNPRFHQLIAPIEDRESTVQAVVGFAPDVVIHLAAQAGVRYSLENPGVYLTSNVLGTQVVLDAVKEAKPRHLLIASTSSVYGGNTKMPFAEQDLTQGPVSLYAATKIASEALAHSYAHLWKIPTTCFRFFTVYGPWGRPDMALFKFVDAIEAGRPIDVYGHGEMRRDFTFIDDLVSAIFRLIDTVPAEGQPVSDHDTLSSVAPFRIVNIGQGAPTGLLDFIEAIEAATSSEAAKNMLPMQPGDVVATFADTTLLRELIGEVPMTPLGDGVRRFVDWYNEYRQSHP